MNWKLKSKTEIDDDTGNPLYQSNEYGWTVKEDATEFSETAREQFNDRAEIMDAVWVQE